MEKWRRECAVKAIVVIIVVSMLVRCVSARNLTVGGVSGWDLSSDVASWSASTSFFAGDSLVFNYTPVHDVLEVNASDFRSCRTINPINVYTDGETVVQLTRPNTIMYFICGRSNHCSRGLKLQVLVLENSNSTARTGRSKHGGGGAPGPSNPGRDKHGGGAHSPRHHHHANPPGDDRPNHPGTATPPNGQDHSSGVAASREVNWCGCICVMCLLLCWF